MPNKYCRIVAIISPLPLHVQLKPHTAIYLILLHFLNLFSILFYSIPFYSICGVENVDVTCTSSSLVGCAVVCGRG